MLVQLDILLSLLAIILEGLNDETITNFPLRDKSVSVLVWKSSHIFTIVPSHGHCLRKGQPKHRINTDIHDSSGIRTHDTSTQGEDSPCLRLSSHLDWSFPKILPTTWITTNTIQYNYFLLLHNLSLFFLLLQISVISTMEKYIQTNGEGGGEELTSTTDTCPAHSDN
jgi:hypothetical protein